MTKKLRKNLCENLCFNYKVKICQKDKSTYEIDDCIIAMLNYYKGFYEGSNQNMVDKKKACIDE